MGKRCGVAILGGSGYGAGELLRLLLSHPSIEAAQVISRSHATKSVSSVHTHLLGLTDITFDAALSADWFSGYERTAVVCAMPSGEAVPVISEMLSRGVDSSTTIIDLSGDLRLKDRATHDTFYPEVPFSADLRSRFVYGLPELTHAALGGAKHITNPGCLATAAILALHPLMDLSPRGCIAVDAKTGTSGAGREVQPAMHHPARSHDCTAYKVLKHRHEPEIVQALGDRFRERCELMFVPHLLPVARGIVVTVYASTTTPVDQSSLNAHYRACYQGSPFIRFRDASPRLVDVVGTNFCDIHLTTRGNQIVAISAMDNLGKGMAGQCLQNMNLAFGLPQETGLLASALGPV